jgi:hypothetical protein
MDEAVLAGMLLMAVILFGLVVLAQPGARNVRSCCVFKLDWKEIHDALIGEMRHVYESDDTPGACRLFFLASIF